MDSLRDLLAKRNIDYSKPGLVLGSAPTVRRVRSMKFDGVRIGVGDMPWRAPEFGPYDYWVTANQHFELSSLETYSIKQLSAEIERVIGKPLMLNWGVLENHKSDIYQKRAIAPLVPDWSPTISLEAGIKDLWINLNATRN
jgi:hypothetical protein